MLTMSPLLFTDAQEIEPKSEPPLAPLVCAMELTAMAKAMQDYHEFAPYMLVQEKQGMSMFERVPPCMLFIRFLDHETFEDRTIIEQTHHDRFISRVDCILAHRDSNGSLMFVPHDTQRLRPYEGPRDIEERGANDDGS